MHVSSSHTTFGVKCPKFRHCATVSCTTKSVVAFLVLINWPDMQALKAIVVKRGGLTFQFFKIENVDISKLPKFNLWRANFAWKIIFFSNLASV